MHACLTPQRKHLYIGTPRHFSRGSWKTWDFVHCVSVKCVCICCVRERLVSIRGGTCQKQLFKKIPFLSHSFFLASVSGAVLTVTHRLFILKTADMLLELPMVLFFPTHLKQNQNHIYIGLFPHSKDPIDIWLNTILCYASKNISTTWYWKIINYSYSKDVTAIIINLFYLSESISHSSSWVLHVLPFLPEHSINKFKGWKEHAKRPSCTMVLSETETSPTMGKLTF